MAASVASGGRQIQRKAPKRGQPFYSSHPVACHTLYGAPDATSWPPRNHALTDPATRRPARPQQGPSRPHRNYMAVPGDLRSLTLMAPQNRPQLAHHPERHANATLDAASVEAIARRVVELMRGEGASSSRRLVDAATLAAELGVTRSWIYEHRDELGALQLGTGPKPRLRFDVQRAHEALIGGSQRPPAGLPSSTRPQSPPVRRRGRPRSTDSLARPGGVLAVRPREATRPPGSGSLSFAHFGCPVAYVARRRRRELPRPSRHADRH